MKDLDVINGMVELGALLLFFLAGTKFRLPDLKRSRWSLSFGCWQAVLSAAVVGVVLLLLGVDWKSSLFTGFLAAVSFTPLALMLRKSRMASGKQAWSIAQTLYPLQCLLVVFLVLLVPVLSGAEEPARGLFLALLASGTFVFLSRGTGELLVFSRDGGFTPRPGDTLVVFLPPVSRELATSEEAPFDQLVTHAFVIELDEADSFEEVVRQASASFALRLPIAADRLARGFLEGSRYGATPVSHGVALPHYRLPHITQPEMVMVRCRSGLSIEFEALHVEEESQALQERLEPVYAIIFLVSPEDNPGRHLRILANIAGRIDDPRFIEAWRSAGDEQQLKEALLHRDRIC